MRTCEKERREEDKGAKDGGDVGGSRSLIGLIIGGVASYYNLII